MEHNNLPNFFEQEKSLNLDPASPIPSMAFVEKIQMVPRKDGLFLVRLFSQDPIRTKEEFRFIGTREFFKQFSEIMNKQLESENIQEKSGNEEKISRLKSEGTKKKSEKK